MQVISEKGEMRLLQSEMGIYAKLYDIARENLQGDARFAVGKEAFLAALDTEDGCLDISRLAWLKDDDFLAAIYLGVLRRIPKESERNFPLDSSEARRDLLRKILTSEEYRERGTGIRLRNNVYE